jgi:hypothetical protein
MILHDAGEAMSWDVFVSNLAPGIRSLDDIPKDFEPLHLGRATADQDSLRESVARWGGFRAQVDKMINGDR